MWWIMYLIGGGEGGGEGATNTTVDVSVSTWARHFTLTVPLSTQVYKFSIGEFNVGG